MRIVIFGATGLTGRTVVTRALEEGHRVVAFARDSSRLAGSEHPSLAVVEGELSHKESVCRAIEGSDAVISVIGPGVHPLGTELSDGVQVIVDAMELLGVRRLGRISQCLP